VSVVRKKRSELLVICAVSVILCS